MKTAIGFLGGKFGDCIIEEPMIRAFLAQNPDYNLILACNQKYAAVLRFYEGYSERIIGFYAYEGYDETWPTENDKAYFRRHQVDLVANAMAAHKEPEWPKFRHQTIECGHMFGIEVTDPKIRLPLPSNIPDNKNRIAIALFPNDNSGVKALSKAKAEAIVDYCRMKGYEVLQLNGPHDPILPHTLQTNTDFYSAGVAMLGCRMLITGDTGMSWLASAFDMPTVGLYSIGYYPFCTTSKMWNPINKNAEYLESFRAEDIPNESIFQKIETVLSQTVQ